MASFIAFSKSFLFWYKGPLYTKSDIILQTSSAILISGLCWPFQCSDSTAYKEIFYNFCLMH